MDVLSITSVFGNFPTKISDCFSFPVGNRKKKTNDRRFLFDFTNGFSNSFSLHHKIQAIHLDEVGADKPESITGLRLKDVHWPSPSDDIPFWKREFHSWDANSEVPSYIEKDSDLLHVIHVTAEMAPIAKVDGLGDVVTGLARACLLRGHNVDIMLPFYECIQKENIQELSLMSTYNSYNDGNWIKTNAYRGIVRAFQ